MNARMNLRTMVNDDSQADMLARRIEKAAFNATAVPECVRYDGWLLRFADEPVKRLCSIYPIDPSCETLDLDARLAHCAQLYEQKGRPMAFRLTGLDDAQVLDQELAARGYSRRDETLVMARMLDAPLDPVVVTPHGTPCVNLDLAAFSETLGRIKNSSESHVNAHARRLSVLAADVLPRCIKRADEPIAVGLAVLEDDLVGVFDVAVATDGRCGGAWRAVCLLAG